MEGSDGPVKMADSRSQVDGDKGSLHLPDKISFWIKWFWYPMITDTSKHNLYLKHFYTDYKVIVVD